MKYDFLIVGTGFYGSVLAERISNVLKKNVLIIDKRSHVGGNCFSDICDKTNIEYQIWYSYFSYLKSKSNGLYFSIYET